MDNRIFVTPFFLDQPRPGLKEVARADMQINEPDLPEGDVQERMIAIQRPLSALVTTAVHNGKRPVSIAGDCCTTIGVLAGLQKAGLWPTLIWFDAHGDFNTWETTPSGFLGGMPLAMLVGRGEMRMAEALEMETLPEERVILTDARDLDPEEAMAVQESAVNHLSDVEELLDAPLPKGPLYVHFDVDVIDVEEVPAVSYPAADGPSVALLGQVFDRLAASGQVAAVSLSSWTPEMDPDGRSREAAMALLQRLISN
ncbi:MAG: arginase family protein [Candidatus Promineifilaceae bacterium]|nr:arginase family protein [Candidatus Promineifilaceae bacterium]